MIKKVIVQLRRKYYFIPLIYALGFGLLSVLLAAVDKKLISQIHTFIPKFLLINNILSEKILILSIGSMLTILTVSFSVIMIVLTLYGNQLSPRAVQDFLEKKTSMRIIGYYVGVLLFCIIALFGIQDEITNVLVLSPAISIILIIIAIVIFIYFMHLVSKSIQLDVYIHDLTREALDIVEKRQRQIDDDPNLFVGRSEDYTKELKGEMVEIIQNETAFIQYYNEKKLLDIAKKGKLVIFCERKAGEHISEGEPLARVYHGNIEGEIDAAIDEIRREIVMGTEANLVNNLYSETGKLVEIAIRTLSPGINDPVTAVTCIDSIGMLLKKAVPASEAKIYKDDNGELRLILEGISFNKLLFEHFYQIMHYSSGDLKIVGAIISALNHISQECTNELKVQIWDFSRFLISGLHIESMSELEKRYTYEMFLQLSVATECSECLNELFKGL
ncbi:MAG: DUF2254 family protein [Clostridia bacterium]|nr:DUF2254 family protein [Clostridia bacterium]